MDALVRKVFVQNVKLAVVVMLFVIGGLAFLAQPAEAAICPDCPPGGGDGNAVPVISAANASITVNEGQTASSTGTFSDADGNSTVTLSASVGTVTKDDANGTWRWSFNTNDGPDQSQTVTITASDGTDTKTAAFMLTVNNLSPVIYWQPFNSLQPPEGVARRYEFGVYDPGNDTFSVHDRWCGSGTRVSQDTHDNDSTAFHYVECRFPDGPGSTVVTATATDSDGASSDTGNLAVEIINVNPTATLLAPTAADQGTTQTISLTNQNDVQADKNAGFRYAFACDGGSLDGATYETSGTSASTTCAMGDSGMETVRARIIDKDGSHSEYTQTITVRDVTAPNATIASGPTSLTRNTSASFGFSSSEPGSKFQCSLDGTVFTTCDSPKSYTGLKNGSHTFKVRAIDTAGNVDATPAVRAWKVDTIKPTVSGMSPRHTSIITDTTPTIKATVKDNFTNLQKGNIKLYMNGVLISPTKYSYSAATDLLTYNSPKLATGKKTVKILATDAARNIGTKSWYFTIR